MAAKKGRRACIAGGYMYRRERGSWDIIMHGKAVCGAHQGTRMLDGMKVEVVKQGGRLYAASPQYVRRK